MTPLEIQVTADIGQLQSKMVAAGSSVTKFAGDASKTVADLRQRLKDLEDARYFETAPDQIRKYNEQIRQTAIELKSLTSAGIEGAKGQDQLSNSIARFTNINSIAAREVNNLGRRILNIGSIVAFGGITAGVSLAIEAIGALIGKESEAQKEQADFNRSLEDAGKKGLATGAQLQALIAVASDHTQSLKTRNEALDEANKLMGKHGEVLTLANVATKAITDQTNLYVQALINEAVASKYADRIADLTIKKTDALKEYTKATEKYNQTVNFAKTDKTSLGDEGQGFADVANVNATLGSKNKAAENLKGIDDQLKILKADLFGVEKQATLAFGVLGNQKEGGANKTSLKSSIDKEYELYKIAQEDKLKIDRDAVADIKAGFEKRLAAAKQFTVDELALFDAERKEELRKNSEKVASLKSNLGGASDGERSNILKELENLNKEREIINAKYATKRIEAERAERKEIIKINDEAASLYNKHQKNNYDNAIKAIEEGATLEIIATEKTFNKKQKFLLSSYEAGKISLKEYNKQKLLLENESAIESLKIEIEKDKKIIALRAALGQDIIKEMGILAKAELDLQKRSNKEYVDEQTKTAKQVEDINQKMADNIKSTLNKSLVGVGESIADAISGGKNLGEVIFGNLFHILGAGIKQLGESLIELGTLKVVVEKYNFTPGVGTIAAGIVGVAIGSLLEKAVPKFAGGVRNFGGGVALVGERGPELVNLPTGSDVIPNHKIGGLIGGGSQVFIPEMVIRGQDIVVAFNRANQTIGRIG